MRPITDRRLSAISHDFNSMPDSKHSTPAPQETGFRADLLKVVYGPAAAPAEDARRSSRGGPVIYRADPALLFKGASMATMTLALLFSPGAEAEDPSAASGDAASMPEVIVRGQEDLPGYHVDSVSLPKYTEPLRDVPQSISVVSQQLMQDQGVSTLRDALRNVSGISLAAGEGSSQGDNLTIRGFTARSDIFLDGMRDFGSYYRDPFNLQQVEVLMGPSSISFGRGSTGGVVNQESKTPNMTQSLAGGLTIGTDRTKRATIDFNEPLPSSLTGSAFRLNIMGDENGVAGREGALYRRFGFAPSLVFGLGTSTRLTLSYYHQTEDNIPDYGIPWLLSRPAPVSRSNFYGFKDGSNFLKTDVDIGTIKLEHDVNENLTIRDQVRYANYFRHAQITEPQIPTTVTAATPLDQIQVTRNEITTESSTPFPSSRPLASSIPSWADSNTTTKRRIRSAPRSPECRRRTSFPRMTTSHLAASER
jgi:outer membrane receptor for monomeric catechols